MVAISYNATEIMMITTSIISAIASFLVILSGFLFPAMRKKKFTQLIFLMSSCDMVANIFGAFGFPKSTSPLCPMQGAMRTFFYRASWVWSVVMTYQLFCTVCYGVIGVSKKASHIFVWLLSVVLLVLPFSTNEYGQDDQFSGRGWCSISGVDTTAAGIWLLVTSQIPVMLCILCNTWYLYQMDLFVSSHIKDISKYPQIPLALKTLRLYPIIMIVAWLPSTVFAPIINFRVVEVNDSTLFLMGLTEAWGGLFGLGLFFIFFTKNREAIFYWRRLGYYLKVRISGSSGEELGDSTSSFTSNNAVGNSESLRKPLFNSFTIIPAKGIFIDNDDDNFNYYTSTSSTSNATLSSKMFSVTSSNRDRSRVDSSYYSTYSDGRSSVSRGSEKSRVVVASAGDDLSVAADGDDTSTYIYGTGTSTNSNTNNQNDNL